MVWQILNRRFCIKGQNLNTEVKYKQIKGSWVENRPPPRVAPSHPSNIQLLRMSIAPMHTWLGRIDIQAKNGCRSVLDWVSICTGLKTLDTDRHPVFAKIRSRSTTFRAKTHSILGHDRHPHFWPLFSTKKIGSRSNSHRDLDVPAVQSRTPRATPPLQAYLYPAGISVPCRHKKNL